MIIAQPSNVLAYLPLYIAIEGTENKIINSETALKSLKAVANDEADISIGDPFLFNYFNYEKNNIKICSAFINKIAHSLITFNPFIKEASEEELKGKTLVCYPEPSTSFFLSQQLKTKQKVGQLIQTPFNTELGPLLTEEADIAIVLEPNITYARRNGARELIDFKHEKAVTTGFCVKKEFYTKNKKELAEFLKLLKSGLETFEKDKDKSFTIAKKYFPLVQDNILREAIESIRNSNIYSKDFSFTEEEIKKGLELRNIKESSKDIKKFFI